MPAAQTKKLKTRTLSSQSVREFRRSQADKETKLVNLDLIAKKLKGGKKVLYKLDVPLEEEKEDPERKAKRDAFLKKRKQFYTDYRQVQLAKVLIKQEESCDDGQMEIEADYGDNWNRLLQIKFLF